MLAILADLGAIKNPSSKTCKLISGLASHFVESQRGGAREEAGSQEILLVALEGGRQTYEGEDAREGSLGEIKGSLAKAMLGDIQNT